MSSDIRGSIVGTLNANRMPRSKKSESPDRSGVTAPRDGRWFPAASRWGGRSEVSPSSRRSLSAAAPSRADCRKNALPGRRGRVPSIGLQPVIDCFMLQCRRSSGVAYWRIPGSATDSRPPASAVRNTNAAHRLLRSNRYDFTHGRHRCKIDRRCRQRYARLSRPACDRANWSKIDHLRPGCSYGRKFIARPIL